MTRLSISAADLPLYLLEREPRKSIDPLKPVPNAVPKATEVPISPVVGNRCSSIAVLTVVSPPAVTAP